MMYTIVRLIAMLFLVLNTKQLAEGIEINNYFQLINDVHRYYHTSCVIFVRSDYCDLNMTTLVHIWSREFSRQEVMTMAITFSDLTSKYNEYQEYIVRPLFVALLDTKESMSEFAKTTRSIKPISFPIWFVVFLQCPGNLLEEHCTHPTYNVFNVDISTHMLVLCYDRPTLVEWYAIRDNRTRTFDLAMWSSDRGLILKTRKSIYARRSDMLGEIVRVASVKNSPLLSLENGKFGGFVGLLMIELSKAMNFTMKILDPVKVGGNWNQQQNNWTGAVGQLVANEADIGASMFVMTPGRREVVDYTIPLIHSQYHLYFKEPKVYNVQWNLYFRAFSFEMWIAIVIIIIVVSLMLTIMKIKNGYFSMDLMFENCINVWGIYCQQGLSEFPRESPVRLAFISIYVSAIIILAIYSALLISFLMLESPKLPFSTLEDYVNDGTYKLIIVQNSAEIESPSRVKDPVFRKMYELLEEEKFLPVTFPEAFKQICQRKNLAIYTTEMLKDASNMYTHCNLVSINTGRNLHMGLMLLKGNPYTGFLNYHLRRMHYNGVISKLRNKYLAKNPPNKMMYSVIDINVVTPILTIIAGSMILALLVLVIEKMYHSFKARFKKNESSVKTLGYYNFDIKNKLRKGNNKKNSQLRGFYNRQIGYW